MRSRRLAIVAVVVVIGGSLLSCGHVHAAEPERPEELSDIRLRAGGSLFGGAFLGAMERAGGGISGRLGVQLGRTYSVYAQPLWTFAASTYLGGSGLMVERTFLDSIYLAAGPEILFGRVRRSLFEDLRSPGPDRNHFAMSARTGVVFGDTSPVRRTGYTIGIDLRIAFANEILYTPLIAFGFDAF